MRRAMIAFHPLPSLKDNFSPTRANPLRSRQNRKQLSTALATAMKENLDHWKRGLEAPQGDAALLQELLDFVEKKGEPTLSEQAFQALFQCFWGNTSSHTKEKLAIASYGLPKMVEILGRPITHKFGSFYKDQKNFYFFSPCPAEPIHYQTLLTLCKVRALIVATPEPDFSQAREIAFRLMDQTRDASQPIIRWQNQMVVAYAFEDATLAAEVADQVMGQNLAPLYQMPSLLLGSLKDPARALTFVKEHGKLFKHFIFSDLKYSSYGSKLIASAFIANGYNLGYKAEPTGNPKKK